MNWILPFTLACCYEYYAHGLKPRSESRPARAAAFALLAAALWLLQSYTRERAHWLIETFLCYAAPFFYLWGSRRCQALEAFYHTVILFLSIDSIVKGLGHLSMVLLSQDYVYFTSLCRCTFYLYLPSRALPWARCGWCASRYLPKGSRS